MDGSAKTGCAAISARHGAVFPSKQRWLWARRDSGSRDCRRYANRSAKRWTGDAHESRSAGTVFGRGQNLETLKIAAGDKAASASQLAETIYQRRVGRGQSSSRGKASCSSTGELSRRITGPSPTATPSLPTPPRAKRWRMKCWLSRLRVRCQRSTSNNFTSSISRGRERCQVFTDDKDLLRSHVTYSSARVAAVEAVPCLSRVVPAQLAPARHAVGRTGR